MCTRGVMFGHGWSAVHGGVSPWLDFKQVILRQK